MKESELLEDEQRVAIAVLNTGRSGREVLTLFRGSEGHADRMIDNENIMSGEGDKIEAAIAHLDMVIILSNLSDHDEQALACKVAAIGKKANVLTLVFNLVAFELKDSAEQLGADLVKTFALETDLYLSVVENEAFEFLTTKAKRIKNAIESVTKILMLPGMICIDLSDLRAAVSTGKLATWGVGGSSDSDIAAAVDAAFSGNDEAGINSANISAVFVTLIGGPNLSLMDFALLGKLLEDRIPETCLIMLGALTDPNFNERCQVSVICIGSELY